MIKEIINKKKKEKNEISKFDGLKNELYYFHDKMKLKI